MEKTKEVMYTLCAE